MSTLASFISRKFVVLSQETPILQAARVMCEHQVGCLLVGDSRGNVAGILTDRDLACRWAANFEGKDVPIERIMTPKPLTVPEDSTIANVLQVMEVHGVRRIPVVRQAAGLTRFAGIVTLDDLVYSNVVSTNQLSRIIRRQLGRRMAEQGDRRPATAQAAARSSAHLQQTFAEFSGSIASATGLSIERVPEVIQAILGPLIMRVSLTAAAHLLAQLPRLVREPLLRLPPGPDRGVSSKVIVHALSTLLRMTPAEAEEVLRHFILAIEAWTGPQAMAHLTAQLPQDFQTYFNRKHPPARTGPDPDPPLTPWIFGRTFSDRVQAARELSEKLSRYQGKHPLVLGIPRGSVPMARLIAERLLGDLDVVLVHKIGAPGHPEYAVGSVSEFGEIYRSAAIEYFEDSPEKIDRIAQAEIEKLRGRRKTYSPIRPPLAPTGRTVIIVDDGIATGSTMLAAVRAIRSQKPARIVVAAPVASRGAIEALEREADEVVVVESPENFFSISQFYEDFPPITDDEVLRTLSEAARPAKKAG